MSRSRRTHDVAPGRRASGEGSAPARRDASALPSGGREWLWPLALAAMIFVASGQGKVAAPDVVSIDKVAHFFVFGLLATLCARVPAVQRVPVLGLYSAIAIASFYGIADEFRQSFTPGREVEFADWITDTVGAVIAVVAYARWTAYRVWLEGPVVARRSACAAPQVAAESS